MKSIDISAPVSGDFNLEGSAECSLCHNLYEGADGFMHAAGIPPIIAEYEEKPIAVDRRPGLINIFTQEDDGTLLHSMRLRDNNQVEILAEALSCISEDIIDAATVGDFLVMRGASKKLYYLHWADHRYTWLGQLPEPPRFYAEASEMPAVEAGIPAVTFKNAIADLRPGLDAESEARVVKALFAAMDEAVLSAADKNCRITPVMVRVGWRMTNGALLAMSDPVIVSGGTLPGAERVILNVTGSDAGFTGTEAGTLKLSAYKLRLKFPSLPSPQWRGIIEGIEVWCTPCSEFMRNEGEGYANTTVQNQRTQLSFAFAVKDMSRYLAELPARAMRLEISESDWTDTMDVPVNRAGITDPEITGNRVPTSMRISLADEIDAMLGYGGLLHLAVGNSLFTSERGNPFALRSATESVGGAISDIWPQLRGGGAYTRQYLYLTTENGLAALTHDREGNHTNCRLISPIVVKGCDKGVTTSAGLFLSGVQGELLCVKDSQVELFPFKIEGVMSLSWSRTRAWLIIAGMQKSIVLQQRRDWRAFTWDFVIAPLRGSVQRRLASHTSALGISTLFDLDGTYEENKNLLYRYACHITPPPRRLSLLRPGISGSDTNATVTLYAGDERSSRLIRRVKAKGNITSRMTMDVMSPYTMSGDAPDWQLTITGYFHELRQWRW